MRVQALGFRGFVSDSWLESGVWRFGVRGCRWEMSDSGFSKHGS